MIRDFAITDGIYLVQEEHELDLHNNFDFQGLDYSIEQRTLNLKWKRSSGDWVADDTPESLEIKFLEVSEFRFNSRDMELPYTEDDCLNSFGYWVDEDWAEGVIMLGTNQKPDPSWPTALDFMSGAVIIVQSESARARIQA